MDFGRYFGDKHIYWFSGDLKQYGYGEVILWRIYCIGPMTTRRTGILELARIDTKQASDFTLVSYFYMLSLYFEVFKSPNCSKSCSTPVCILYTDVGE